MATPTTVSEELGSLKLSDQPSLFGEVVLEVSPKFAQFPLGFALDAGYIFILLKSSDFRL